MGSNTSKSINETASQTQKNGLDVDTNPDPRSPTPEITRTPLQNKNGTKHNITKNIDLRKTFESGQTDVKLNHNNPILSAVIKNHLQSYDPRSPTQEFERTPLILPPMDEDSGIITKHNIGSQNNNTYASPCLKKDADDHFNTSDVINLSPDLVIAKNLCDGFYDLSLNETQEENVIPLESSTNSNSCVEENFDPVIIEQPKVLLETNFDYVEFENDKSEDSKEKIHSNEDIDDCEFEFKDIPQFKILKDDPRSPSVDIKRTPMIVATEENATQANVEQMSDDTLIKVLQTSNSELSNDATDNKDGVLIYEDESGVMDTPKKAKSMSTKGSRTPLSCMKNTADATHTRSKSANTFEKKKTDSVKPVKHLKYVSHIPRLKSLSKQMTTGSSVSLKNISKSSSISGDCENTPPHSHRDIWDKDNSIVL